jgi:membrane fusion protein, multidrug efflux system
MKPIKFITGLFCVALAVLPACSKQDGQKVARQNDARPVSVVVATNAAWDRTVSIVGTLFPKDEATIAAQVEGTVEKTLVDFGDRVKSEQDLASVDTASYAALLEQAMGNLAKAEASLTNARLNFERVQRLKLGGIASDADFDQTKSQLDQATADVKAASGAEGVARLNVERSRVRAPFDGAISQRLVARGDYVKAGSPLFNIVNDGVLKFIFQVPERYGSFVEKRLPVSFNVDNFPGEVFTGSVYLISPSVSMASRSFNVGALVTNTDFRLKASTFARGELVVQRAVPTPVVPLEAIVSFAGVTKVFVIENGVARSQQVALGRVRDGLQEIISGVKAGDQVVISGQSKLSDGVAVAIQAVEAKSSVVTTNQAATYGH